MTTTTLFSKVPCFHSEGFLEMLSGWAQDPSAQEWKAVWQGEGDSTQKARWEKRGRWLSALVHGDDKSWSELAKNAGVRGMQSVLACLGAHGWPCDPGKVDGAAGARTFNGIVQFQHACNEALGAGLVIDGQFGPKSWKAAFTALRHLIKAALTRINELNFNSSENFIVAAQRSHAFDEYRGAPLSGGKYSGFDFPDCDCYHWHQSGARLPKTYNEVEGLLLGIKRIDRQMFE